MTVQDPPSPQQAPPLRPKSPQAPGTTTRPHKRRRSDGPPEQRTEKARRTNVTLDPSSSPQVVPEQLVSDNMAESSSAPALRARLEAGLNLNHRSHSIAGEAGPNSGGSCGLASGSRSKGLESGVESGTAALFAALYLKGKDACDPARFFSELRGQPANPRPTPWYPTAWTPTLSKATEDVLKTETGQS
ncbi:hypothetical protein C8Q78DRAFT_1077075 [Trametes maxima]|nr:hypothetical protein C8Q78DRAFT_1077075 [Trametes maxima]